MKDSRNEKIEWIERRLLKANRISPEEIREIVSAPPLFDKINARIKAEQSAQKSKVAAGKWTIMPLWNWRKPGLAFGSFAIFMAVALSLIFWTRQDYSTLRLNESVAAPEIQEPFAVVDEPEITDSGKSENPFGRVRNRPERIAYKNKALKSLSNSLRNPRQTERNEVEEAFYPLAFAENLEEAKVDSRIIRVVLSRSSLLALGINPPLDDENLKIKTDLLVGSDGVAHGIRFVK